MLVAAPLYSVQRLLMHMPVCFHVLLTCFYVRSQADIALPDSLCTVTIDNKVSSAACNIHEVSLLPDFVRGFVNLKSEAICRDCAQQQCTEPFYVSCPAAPER